MKTKTTRRNEFQSLLKFETRKLTKIRFSNIIQVKIVRGEEEEENEEDVSVQQAKTTTEKRSGAENDGAAGVNHTSYTNYNNKNRSFIKKNTQYSTKLTSKKMNCESINSYYCPRICEIKYEDEPVNSSTEFRARKKYNFRNDDGIYCQILHIFIHLYNSKYKKTYKFK